MIVGAERFLMNSQPFAFNSRNHLKVQWWCVLYTGGMVYILYIQIKSD